MNDEKGYSLAKDGGEGVDGPVEETEAGVNGETAEVVGLSEEARKRIGLVVIGRNEGERLKRCLKSVAGRVEKMVYVDSGSSDGSVEFAKSKGVHVVELDMDRPFTMARGRNAGWRYLAEECAGIELVQFVDGDCEVVEGWIEKAYEVLNVNEDVVAVYGRRRERHPEASVYNAITDIEWDHPLGESKACGGDAMMRLDVVKEVEGYNEGMIAGEEAEMCVRMRRRGWKILRIDAEMTLHDMGMTRFSQWWKRSIRSGHAYAEGAALQGNGPERHNVRQVQRTVLWGMMVPGVLVLSFLIAFMTGWWVAWVLMLMILLLLLIQTYRVYLGYRKRDFEARSSRWCAMFVTISKVAQAMGVLQYWINRRLNRQTKLIEYRDVESFGSEDEASGNVASNHQSGEMIS